PDGFGLVTGSILLPPMVKYHEISCLHRYLIRSCLFRFLFNSLFLFYGLFRTKTSWGKGGRDKRLLLGWHLQKKNNLNIYKQQQRFYSAGINYNSTPSDAKNKICPAFIFLPKFARGSNMKVTSVTISSCQDVKIVNTHSNWRIK
ncbi:MAG: hypothetical protein DRJ08_07850, partial [Acidobacteria bacterium]